MKTSEYIEHHEDGYRVRGARVSLDSIVYAFQRGASPESIQRSYPTLTLEEVYGAITYYLANEQEIEDHLRQSEAGYEREAEERRQQLRRANPELYRKLAAARAGREMARG